jgi:hypothetical protein
MSDVQWLFNVQDPIPLCEARHHLVTIFPRSLAP